jgi:hypothetical protein
VQAVVEVLETILLLMQGQVVQAAAVLVVT